MRPPKLVIFDCDGVLVDSESASNSVLAEALTAIGVPTTTEQATERYRGKLLLEIGEDVRASSGVALSDAFWADYERDRTRAFEQGLEAINGAEDTISTVKASGIRVCVASQGKRSKTELTLGLTGLRGLFADDAIFSAYDVARGKPHPDLFLHAAAGMQTAPPDCVVVEDTAIGIRAAVAAGMTPIGLASGAEARAIEALEAPTIAALRDLPPMLGIG